MKISEIHNAAGEIPGNRPDPANIEEESAMEFERLFARQMVREMTSGLFEEKEKGGMMGASGGLYREHIIDTLSNELAKQEKLGMAEKVRSFWERRTSQPAGPTDATNS